MHMRRFGFAAVLAVVVSAPLAAHHGAAIYDQSKTVTVTGTVTQFRFVNPHVLIFANVTGPDGKTVEWSGELTSPTRLARGEEEGGVKWTRDIIKPGDTITLTGSPARNGAPALVLQQVVAGDGRVLVGNARTN
jgi:Family of unknown function (DUF6152)